MENIKSHYLSRIEKNVVWSKLNESIIIVALKEKEDKLFKLNTSAAYLWELSDGTKTVGDLVKKLCEKFAIDEATALNDTVAFIENMESRQLLAVSDTAA